MSKPKAGSTQTEDHYVLELYVAGATLRSEQAMVNIRKVCEANLKDRYELEVIDISLHPELAARAGLIAAPTLIKKLPLPLRRYVGDMLKPERILDGLKLGQAN